ncbi:MAG: DUF5050 domain-containing protein [Clostridia bacterium]|nr:DUF5050 domain-containing protein [Clostridia bacterium]
MNEEKTSLRTSICRIKRGALPMLMACSLILSLCISGCRSKNDTPVSPTDEPAASSESQEPVESTAAWDADVKHIDNSYFQEGDDKTGNGCLNMYVHQYGDYLYYVDSRPLWEEKDGEEINSYIIRALSLDGAKMIEIDRSKSGTICFDDSKMCYVAMNNMLCVYDLDSHTKQEILPFTSDLGTDVKAIYGNHIYLYGSNDQGLCVNCLDTATGAVSTVCQVSNWVWELYEYQSKLYISVLNDGVYKMDGNGENMEKIIDLACDHMAIYQDRIYVRPQQIKDVIGIWRYDLDGKNKEVLIKASYTWFDIIDNQLIYNTKVEHPNGVGKSYSVGNAIMRYDLESGEKTTIMEIENQFPICAGNWIYFEDWSEDQNQQRCRIRLDGTGYMSLPYYMDFM